MRTIDAKVITANLFAAGRQYVMVRDLNQIKEELHNAFAETTKALNLESVYIEISRDTLCNMVEDWGFVFAVCDDIYFRSEWSFPEYFCQEYVNEVFNWHVPVELREVFDTVICQHAVDSLAETPEIIRDRIGQLEQMAKRFCPFCGANRKIRPSHIINVAFIHQGWNVLGYSWADTVACRANPERARQALLRAQLDQMLVAVKI
ncbi:MAG: hypothetical protein NTW50_00070 [Candidatus Berkelbacteria bacterium]|nr:hypothetical protein [Candidatus Berkelbacteria bacterium]